jgi:hypothetical protein
MNAPSRAQCPRLLELWEIYFEAVERQTVAVQELGTAVDGTGNNGDLLVTARNAGTAAARARFDIKNHRAEHGC